MVVQARMRSMPIVYSIKAILRHFLPQLERLDLKGQI